MHRAERHSAMALRRLACPPTAIAISVIPVMVD
jgi:hypothetical protein